METLLMLELEELELLMQLQLKLQQEECESQQCLLVEKVPEAPTTAVSWPLSVCSGNICICNVASCSILSDPDTMETQVVEGGFGLSFWLFCRFSLHSYMFVLSRSAGCDARTGSKQLSLGIIVHA